MGTFNSPQMTFQKGIIFWLIVETHLNLSIVVLLKVVKDDAYHAEKLGCPAGFVDGFVDVVH